LICFRVRMCRERFRVRRWRGGCRIGLVIVVENMVVGLRKITSLG